ncbi:MAG: helix-turn-helix domain-containing protein [Sciscionella sp.]
MTPTDSDSLGNRINRLRRRAGLTQEELGMRVNRTQAWVSKVERDRVEIDSVSLLNAIAWALKAHPNELTGRPYYGQTVGDERGYSAVAELIRQLRRAQLPAEGERHRPLDDLAADLAHLTRQRGQARYAQLAESAITLLAELHIAYEYLAAGERERAYTLYALTCKEVHSVAYGLGYPELIAYAQMRTRWAAELSGDPNLVGVADYLAARDLWTTNDYGDAMLLLDRTAGTVQSAAEGGDPASVSLYGALHLRAAVTAARANNADEAYTRLDLAQTALSWADPSDPYTLWWSAGNIGVHRVGIAVELGDGVEAVRRAQGFILPKELPPSRIGHYFLDLTRGYVWINNVERALAALERAEHLAPQLVHNHPMAQAAVRQLLRLERASTRERLRSIANRFHVE